MNSELYRLWFDAIRYQRRLSYSYEGKRREGCPHVLGLDRAGNEKVLVYRIIPGSRRPASWRCLYLSKTANLKPVSGDWLEGQSHIVRNSCIVDVHIDVNRAAEQRFDWTKNKMTRRTPAKTVGAARSQNKKPRKR